MLQDSPTEAPHRITESVTILHHGCSIYNCWPPIPGSKEKNGQAFSDHQGHIKPSTNMSATSTPPLCASSGSKSHHFIWQNGIIKATSSQVPEHVRVIFVSFQIISGDQIFNPLLNCLEVRL